jgi:5-methylcytosine-specific restriction endonuclease McrA
VVAYLGTDWPALRRSVLARSGGLCALCGIDVPAFRRRVGEALLAAWRGRLRGPVLEGETELPGNLWRDDERRAVLVALGDSRAWPREPNRDWWEADHVLPVVLGGRDELSNLRLLCVPCHKGETRALARRRAEERKDAKIGGRLFGSSIAP